MNRRALGGRPCSSRTAEQLLLLIALLSRVARGSSTQPEHRARQLAAQQATCRASTDPQHEHPDEQAAARANWRRPQRARPAAAAASPPGDTPPFCAGGGAGPAARPLGPGAPAAAASTRARIHSTCGGRVWRAAAAGACGRLHAPQLLLVCRLQDPPSYSKLRAPQLEQQQQQKQPSQPRWPRPSQDVGRAVSLRLKRADSTAEVLRVIGDHGVAFNEVRPAGRLHLPAACAAA